MMLNRSITLESLAALACWIAGTTLALGDMFGFTPQDSGFVGIIAVAFGHLVSVQKAHRELEQRERGAYELGVAAGRDIMRPVR